MIRKDFIIDKARNYLAEFLGPIGSQADKPRRKFLRQAIGAILLSGSLVVMEFSRLIHDDCSDIFYRVKRLLNHLVSERGELSAVVQAYRRQMARYIEPDTLIIADLTDLAKPRARKMEYLKLVRDGSEDKLVCGYLCMEVYAYGKGKKIIPLALDVFSTDDPAVGSQNLQIERTVDSVNEALGGNGIWLADRGFDALNLYEIWFSRNCHFVVRQRGDRCVITSNGVRIAQRDLVEHLRHRRAMEHESVDMIFCKVKLPDHNQWLYLVACWLPKAEVPLMLLTTLVVQNEQQARQIIGHYRKRWSCEETIQFLKSRVGLERFRIRRYRAIQRLATLAMLAMGFLSWILFRSKRLTHQLFALTSRFRQKPRFVYYRLLDGLQELARLCHLSFGQMLFQQLKNG
jgi:hypothetical protein